MTEDIGIKMILNNLPMKYGNLNFKHHTTFGKERSEFISLAKKYLVTFIYNDMNIE